MLTEDIFENRYRSVHAKILLFVIICVLVCLCAYAGKETESIGEKILEGARKEVVKKTKYVSGWAKIEYPNGDVSANIGVCTDLIVRAFRNAQIDLQQLIHEDRKKNAQDYPTYLWENKEPDTNIDHRRCQNMYVFFKNFAQELTVKLEAEDLKEWQAGDVVFFKLETKQFPWHVAIVSDKKDRDKVPYVVHLYPPNASEEQIDDYLPIHSHFRWTQPFK